jgi:dTDP-4-dehydrorhamnose reductase
LKIDKIILSTILLETDDFKGYLMKILITGSNGMLGHDLLKVLSKNHEIIATNSKTLDISNKEIAMSFIKKCNPDLVINSGAYTDVDGAQINKELSFRVNALGAKNIAIACKENDSEMVQISTDYVFDGSSKCYNEEDETNPINIYGQTKLQGEVFVKEILDSYYIVRTSWLYGFNGKNFVKTMLELSKTNDEISVVNDQTGSPTFTHDLSIAISKLIGTHKYNKYHITNSDNCSWFDFAKEIFEVANLDVNLKPIPTTEFPRPAKRPKYSILKNKNWKTLGFDYLRSYKKAIIDYIELEKN